MRAFLRPISKKKEPSSPVDGEKSTAYEPTIEEIKGWDEEELLNWIQQKLPRLFKPTDTEDFLDA